MGNFFLFFLLCNYANFMTSQNVIEPVTEIPATLPNEIVYTIFQNLSPQHKTASQLWLWLWAFDSKFKYSSLPIKPIVQKYIEWGHHKLITGKLKNTGILTACAVLRKVHPKTYGYIHELLASRITLYNCHLIFGMEQQPYFIPKEELLKCLESKTNLNLQHFKKIENLKDYYYLSGEENSEISSIVVLNPKYNIPYQQNLIRIASIRHHTDAQQNGSFLLFIKNVKSTNPENLLLIQLPIFGERKIVVSKRDMNVLSLPYIAWKDPFFDWLSSHLLALLKKSYNQPGITKELTKNLDGLRTNRGLPHKPL